MTELADFAKMNAVYETMFRFPYPARSTVGVESLPKGGQIEIECIENIEKPPFVKTM
jgi:2-iminobutanoate/2-iminopropanoate deaminase